MKRIFILCVLLIILPLSYAQEPPEPPSSASLQSLINSIQGMQQEMKTLKRDMQEFKTQLNIKLDKYQKDTLLFLLIFFISYSSLLEIVERLGSWILWKRRKREIRNHQEAIINNLQTLDFGIMEIISEIDTIKRELGGLKEQVKPPEIWAEQQGKRKVIQTFILMLILAIILLGVGLWLIP